MPACLHPSYSLNPKPNCFFGNAGTLVTAIVTGLCFAKFSRPTARVLFADRMVVCPRNGVDHLMIRIANWRRNQIVEARLQVSLIVREVTDEGESHVSPVPLKLVRSSTQLFWLPWTAMHAIDEDSPLFGPDTLKKLRREDALIYVTFHGLDSTTGNSLYAGARYTMDEVCLITDFALSCLAP